MIQPKKLCANYYVFGQNAQCFVTMSFYAFRHPKTKINPNKHITVNMRLGAYVQITNIKWIYNTFYFSSFWFQRFDNFFQILEKLVKFTL